MNAIIKRLALMPDLNKVKLDSLWPASSSSKLFVGTSSMRPDDENKSSVEVNGLEQLTPTWLH